ncbi:hypothetical protein DUPY_02100 [Duganella phyllosphaerae]|uniref:Uncharacterized protein n=1 Tax=Duganella phyllosphaerae TaxID=762836 RepID=A0A1E7X7U9_9BURK|nr:hypothetical protein DUPY_02100 [Duganella phyllosphaerae]
MPATASHHQRTPPLTKSKNDQQEQLNYHQSSDHPDAHAADTRHIAVRRQCQRSRGTSAGRDRLFPAGPAASRQQQAARRYPQPELGDCAHTGPCGSLRNARISPRPHRLGTTGRRRYQAGASIGAGLADGAGGARHYRSRPHAIRGGGGGRLSRPATGAGLPLRPPSLRVHPGADRSAPESGGAPGKDDRCATRALGCVPTSGQPAPQSRGKRPGHGSCRSRLGHCARHQPVPGKSPPAPGSRQRRPRARLRVRHGGGRRSRHGIAHPDRGGA